MLFKPSSLKPVDFAKLSIGDVANATISSISYSKDYCFASLVADNETVRCIIGSKADYPLKDALLLKGIEVQITFNGTKVDNGVTYPRYLLAF